MKLTKQHFRMVANAIRKIENPEIKAMMIEDHIALFEKSNPRFDKERFIKYIETGSDKK